MSSAARLTYAIAILIGLFLGPIWGYERTAHRLNAQNDALRFTAQGELEDFSSIQYRHADHDHAKAALFMYKNLLEQLERTKPQRVLKLKLSITFTRLALLEDKTYNEEQSRAFMHEAKLWCDASGSHECSETEMKSMTEEFDRQQAIYEP